MESGSSTPSCKPHHSRWLRSRIYAAFFSRSLAAKLIDGNFDFVPQLPVDNTEYYEGKRQEFQSNGWSKLPIDEREAAVTQLLEKFAELENEDQGISSSLIN